MIVVLGGGSTFPGGAGGWVVSQQWTNLPERGSRFSLNLIRWIGLHGGRSAARLLLYPISAYFLLTTRRRRRASRRYLRRVLQRQPRWWDLLRHYHCFSATILDRIHLLAGELDRFDIRVHGGQVVLDQIDSGQGCILLGSHLGSFEVLRVLGITQRHFPLKILMNVDHNARITQILSLINPHMARTIIPIRGPETLLKVRENLERGNLIGTLGDRIVAGDKIVRCRFLGGEADFPAGSLLLAAMTGCPVILVFGLYRGGNRYEVYFERLVECLQGDRGQRWQAVCYWTQRYVDRLEHFTRSAPYNWFNFYDFWKED